jgi:IS5 family transposase
MSLLATINAILYTKGLMLKTGTVVDTTLIAAPRSMKKRTGERDSQDASDLRGEQMAPWCEAHTRVNTHFGHVRIIIGTAENVLEITRMHGLFHGGGPLIEC